jgi:hypothetical protein
MKARQDQPSSYGGIFGTSIDAPGTASSRGAVDMNVAAIDPPQFIEPLAECASQA